MALKNSDREENENLSLDTNDLIRLLQEIKKEKEELQKTKENLDEMRKDLEEHKKEVASRFSESEKTVSSTSQEGFAQTGDSGEKIAAYLKTLANNRTNKEVVIVHCVELASGLANEFALSGLTLRFTKLGEKRTINLDQFEELCSNYRGIIDSGIIKVDRANADLISEYNIQCYDDGKTLPLTPSLLNKLPDMTDEELKSTYERLSEGDRVVILNYWLAKCYARPEDRDPRFYNRYKIEYLNKLSDSYVFDNIIADMNHSK